MKKHFKQQAETITAAYEKLDENDYEAFLQDCITAIRGGHAIIATALGKNVPICEKFVGTLNSLGIDAHFMHSNTAIHGDLGMVHPGDVVVVLSKSGETEETVYLCELLRNRQTKDWLLTCNGDSKAGKLVDDQIVLSVEHEGDPWNIVPNNSTLVFMVFLQSACMEIIDRLPVKLETFKQNHPGGSIGAQLKKE